MDNIISFKPPFLILSDLKSAMTLIFGLPYETKKSFSVDDEGTRWFHTGDAGHIDEDNHVIYLDRMKDIEPESRKG